MTVYWVGSEKEAFDLSGGPSTLEFTTSTRCDPTYSRLAISMQTIDPDAWLTSPDLGLSLTEAWVHWFASTLSTLQPGNRMIELINSSGQVIFRLTVSGSNVQASYWNGAGFTNVGTASAITFGTRTYDLHLKCGVSGAFEFIENGTVLHSGTFSDANCDNVAKARFYSWGANNGSNSTAYSQCMLADVPTVGWHVFTVPPTGNGANTAWAGAFGDVDEEVLSDADFISGAANGDIETFTGAATTLTGFSVKAVVVSARVKRDSAGPQNMQMVLREASTNYFSSNVAALGTAFAPRQAIFANDPATAAPWTVSDAGSAGLEFGVKAIT